MALKRDDPLVAAAARAMDHSRQSVSRKGNIVPQYERGEVGLPACDPVMSTGHRPEILDDTSRSTPSVTGSKARPVAQPFQACRSDRRLRCGEAGLRRPRGLHAVRRPAAWRRYNRSAARPDSRQRSRGFGSMSATTAPSEEGIRLPGPHEYHDTTIGAFIAKGYEIGMHLLGSALLLARLASLNRTRPAETVSFVG